MAIAADKIPGISIDVEDLVAVRGQLGALTLRDLRRRSSYRSGARETRIRGRGMEYEESRAYVPGDDMRTMDWRVMARTGEAHSKVFAEEKERRFLLALDLSASMFFGTRLAFKSWAAAQTAAHVGWLASLAGDRIGGLIVAPQTHQEVRPGRYRAGLMAVFHHLAAQAAIELPASPAPGRLDFLLLELLRVVKPGATISLISDFIGLSQHTSALLSALVRHNDLHIFWIHDRTETESWPDAHYEILLDARKQGLDLNNGAVRQQLSQRQQTHRQAIEALATGFDVPLFPISCNDDVNRQILAQLKS